MSEIAQTLTSIVSAASVFSWESLEEVRRAPFSQAIAPPHQPVLVEPNSIEELSAVMTCAHSHHWRVLPCGNGSKLHWGGLAQKIDLIISTRKLDRLIEHAMGDLTITAEAGMRLAELQVTLAQAGQFLPIDPSYVTTATLGGIIATADTGALRQRYGGIRDLLIGVSFVRSDGAIAKAGGRVVKNVAGYDLMKLFTGSYGTLGIISQVTFRIYPQPTAAQTVVLTGSAEGVAQAIKTVLASSLTPTAIALVPASTAIALGLEHSLTLMIRFQSIDISIAQQSTQLLQMGTALGLQGMKPSDGATLWQQLQNQIESPSPALPIACKIGVLPTQGVEMLEKIRAIAPATTGCIDVGSGLGTLRLDSLPTTTLLQLRQLCQAQGGFLSILEAPVSLKQSCDIWGYPGNALDLMQKIKSQFDPTSILSPQRFVGNI